MKYLVFRFKIFLGIDQRQMLVNSGHVEIEVPDDFDLDECVFIRSEHEDLYEALKPFGYWELLESEDKND